MTERLSNLGWNHGQIPFEESGHSSFSCSMDNWNLL